MNKLYLHKRTKSSEISRQWGFCSASIFLALILIQAPKAVAASPFITLDDPFSSTAAAAPTQLVGVSGTNSVGTYADTNDNLNSFLVNGFGYTILNDPLSSSNGTTVTGIAGGTAFGTYLDTNGATHCFLSDGVNYSTIDETDPSAAAGTTVITGVSGSDVVGNYSDTSFSSHGFLFNGTSFITVDDTNAVLGESTVVGVSGSTIVGIYNNALGDTYGFVTSDGVNFTDIYGPEGTNDGVDSITGISGTSIAGTYTDTNTGNLFGFLTTDDVTYTPIPGPSGTNVILTSITGVSGSNVVGNYTDTISGNTYGFITSDGVNYTILDDTNDPIAQEGKTIANGISGNTVFGSFTGTDGNVYYFNYDIPSTTYTTFNGPPDWTMTIGISGSTSAGSYQDIYGNLNSYFFNGTSYVTVNDPNATPNTTTIAALSGSKVAGTYSDSNSGNTYGFLYSGSQFTPIYGPQGSNAFNNGGGLASILGISGSIVVGTYTDTNSGNSYGFVYSAGTYTPFYGPQGTNAFNNGGGFSVAGISGSTVFGTYTDTNTGNTYGYKYVSGTGYSSIYGPLGTNGGLNSIAGISGSSIAGTYTDPSSGNTYGFLSSNSGASYSIIPGPLGTNGNGVTSITGVSGTTVVGNFSDSNSLSHGFVLIGTNYSVVDFPDAQPGGTTLTGVSSNNYSGTYVDNFGLTHGFLIEPTGQIISFPQVPSQGFGTPYTLGATDSNIDGQPINYTVTGPATLSNGILTFTGLGTVKVVANQPGNIYYYAASPVTNSFTVVPGNQSITFGTISSQTYGVPFTVSPSSSSGLPVSVSVLSGPATSSGTNGTTITPTGIGTVTLTASQGGSANYLAAPMITNSFAVLQATQSIAPFAGISNIAYSTSPVTVTLPVASSGLTVSLLASGSATNNGNLLTLLGVGTVTLTASQAGNSNYLAAAPEITNFVISQATQIIASFSIGDQTYGNPPFNVTPPTGGGSGNPVVLSILSGPATIVSNTITITGAGNVVVAADQSGNSNYSAANEVTSGFNVAQATQTITPFTRIPNQSGFSPLTITPPVSSSGLPVTVSVISGNATILGNVVTPTNSPATIELAANQPGNSNYLAASQVTTIFSAGKSDQTIAAFGSIPNQTYGTSPLNVTPPAASSALPVVLSVLSGPATISGNKVSLTGVGTVVLAADQSGNATYGPADEVTTSFNVTQGSQVIGAFNTIGSQVYGTPVTITPPAASSGLPVSVSVLSGPATILGDVVTPTGVGTVTIAANQTGNPDYLAASQVTTSFAIAQASQSIGAFSIPDQTYGNAPFSVTPPEGGGSDNPVTLSILSGPATISNNVITITGTGNVTVAANQVGNSNYTAASQVTTSFTIAQESQNIAPFPTIPPQKRTKKLDMYTITPPTASSGLPVNVSVLSGPATISGDVLTLTAKGVVTLAANQAGNTNYLAAPQQTISFPVNLKSQSIKLSGIKNGDQIAYTPKALHIATASSELPVALAVTSGPAIVSGERLFIDGVGTVTVTLNQAGNSIYYEAPEVTLTFTVNPANQTIMPIVISSSIKFSNTPVRVPIPKTSSGLPASFSIVSGPASVSGNEITLTGTGEVVLKASQGGNSDYLPVSETISFKVH